MGLRDFLRTLLIVPVIIIFWRCPLYYGDVRTGEVSGVLRTCYEIFGAAREVQMNPPQFIVNFCTMHLPRKFEMDVATRSSSIVAVQRHVERYLYTVQHDGFLMYLWRGLFSLNEILLLTEAANWIRLLPSMLVSSPQLRGGLFTFYFMAIVRGIPVGWANIGYGAHILAVVALIDWVLYVREETAAKLQKYNRGSAEFKRQLKRSILTQEGLFFLMQVLLPVVVVMTVVTMMMTLAYVIETYA